jgi:hypothetical protein
MSIFLENVDNHGQANQNKSDERIHSVMGNPSDDLIASLISTTERNVIVQQLNLKFHHQF